MLRFVLRNEAQPFGTIQDGAAQFLVTHTIKFARFATLRTLNALA
jgi:hypothetical protein